MANIALIDDSTAAIGLLGDILQDEGHSILQCTDVDGVEDKVLEFSPDLIFLDIVMPKRNGYEVLRSFKRNEQLKDVPVIFTSTKQGETDIRWGLKQGAVAYIPKPFVESQITSALSQHLSSS